MTPPNIPPSGLSGLAGLTSGSIWTPAPVIPSVGFTPTYEEIHSGQGSFGLTYNLNQYDYADLPTSNALMRMFGASAVIELAGYSIPPYFTAPPQRFLAFAYPDTIRDGETGAQLQVNTPFVVNAGELGRFFLLDGQALNSTFGNEAIQYCWRTISQALRMANGGTK